MKRGEGYEKQNAATEAVAAVIKKGTAGSRERYVLGLRAFLALRDVELYFLAFGQSFKSRTVDRAEVNEDVRTTFLSDETETFGFVEPLDVAGADIGHSGNPVTIK
jgi:hypothetical protein